MIYFICSFVGMFVKSFKIQIKMFRHKKLKLKIKKLQILPTELWSRAKISKKSSNNLEIFLDVTLLWGMAYKTQY